MSDFSRIPKISFMRVTTRRKLHEGCFITMKNRIFRTGDVSLCRSAKRTWSDYRFDTPGKPNFPNAKQIAFSLNLSNFQAIFCVLTPSKRNIPNRKEIAVLYAKANFQYYDALKKKIFQIGKNTLFLCAKTNWSEILASWCPEKTNFPNAKQITFSLCQSKLEQFSQFWRLEKAHFPNPNEIAFSWSQIILTRLPAFWLHQKAIFRMRKKSLFHVAKKSSRNYLRFGTHIIRILKIRKKCLFRCVIPTLMEFSALWLSE